MWGGGALHGIKSEAGGGHVPVVFIGAGASGLAYQMHKMRIIYMFKS